MMDTVLTVVGMFVLLLLKGFFSGSEIALVNSDKLKLRHQAKQGHSGSKLVLKLLEHPERLLATTLVGTNIFSVALVTLGSVMLIRHFGESGDLLALLLITPVMLIFGEVVPKSVYQQKADVVAPVIIYPLRFFSWLFLPIILIFSWFARLGVWLFSGKRAGMNVFVGREKIRTLLESAEQVPGEEIFDRQRIRRAIRFSDVATGEAMVPLGDAVVFNSERGFPQALEIVRNTGYHRLPVYDTDASQIIGILVLTIWDLLDPEIESKALTDFLHPAFFAVPSQPIEELLPLLQKRPDHMAIVVDEFGSAVGLITVEDILEEVVGDIEDTDFQIHNHKKHSLEEQGDNVYLADAHLPILDLNELLNLRISTKESRTVGGLLVSRLKHIPEMNEFIVESGYRIIVVDRDEKSVRKVKIQPENT